MTPVYIKKYWLKWVNVCNPYKQDWKHQARGQGTMVNEEFKKKKKFYDQQLKKKCTCFVQAGDIYFLNML